MPSDQKENKSKVLPHFLFYRKICLSLIRTGICIQGDLRGIMSPTE
jgi:hypothetical protein